VLGDGTACRGGLWEFITEESDMTTTEGTASAGSSSASQRTGGELASDANRLKDTATHRAKQEAEVRKSEAARAAKSASSALDKAVGELELDDSAPGWLKSAFKQAADGIDRIAETAEGRSVDDLGRDVSRFAREHPGAFLAASAAAGFAAARFLRAGADYQHDHQPQQSQGGYGQTAGGQATSGQTTSGLAAPVQYAGQEV
jgi:hypothetical protein